MKTLVQTINESSDKFIGQNRSVVDSFRKLQEDLILTKKKDKQSFPIMSTFQYLEERDPSLYKFIEETMKKIEPIISSEDSNKVKELQKLTKDLQRKLEQMQNYMHGGGRFLIGKLKDAATLLSGIKTHNQFL